MTRSSRNTIVVLSAIVVLMVVYIFVLRAQLQEQQALVASYKEKAEALAGITRTEAKKVNDIFIERFFNYQNTADRYKKLKEIMTEQGFKAAHPSGDKVPEKGADVKARAIQIQSYEQAKDRTHVEYISTFTQTVSFNGQSTNTPMIIKTKLVLIEGQGWKVDDIENIPIGSEPVRILGSFS